MRYKGHYLGNAQLKIPQILLSSLRLPPLCPKILPPILKVLPLILKILPLS